MQVEELGPGLGRRDLEQRPHDEDAPPATGVVEAEVDPPGADDEEGVALVVREYRGTGLVRAGGQPLEQRVVCEAKARLAVLATSRAQCGKAPGIAGDVDRPPARGGRAVAHAPRREGLLDPGDRGRRLRPQPDRRPADRDREVECARPAHEAFPAAAIDFGTWLPGANP